MKGERKGKLIRPIAGVVQGLAADYVQPGTLAASAARAMLDVGAIDDVFTFTSATDGVQLAGSSDGMVHLKPPAAKGVLCLTFDDCYIAQRQVLNYMSRYHQRATVFVTKLDLTGSFGYSLGHPNFITLQDCVGFQSHGHEIGNHTKTHISMAEASFATQGTQLDDLTDEMTAAGLRTPTSFAYPFGWYNRDSDSILASRGFRVRRYAGNPIHSLPIAGHYFYASAHGIASQSVPNKPPGYMNISDVKRWLDRAVMEPIAIVLFLHLGPQYIYPADKEPTVAEMMDLLDYARSVRVPCQTLQETFGGFNMLANPGFENAYDGWHIENYTAGAAVSTPTTTPDDGLGGTKSLKFVLDTVADLAFIGQRVVVPEPGGRYNLSARYKITDTISPATYVTDDFSDTASNSWGSADTGGAWTVGVIGRAQDFDKASGTGTIVIPDTTNISQLGLLNAMTIRKDYDVYVRFKFDKFVAGTNLNIRVVGRYVDATHYVWGAAKLVLAGNILLSAGYRNGGAEVAWGDDLYTRYNNAMFGERSNVENHWYGMRWQFNGTRVRGRIWADQYERELDVWDYDETNASAYNTAGVAGLGVVTSSALTNAPITLTFDNFTMQQSDPNNAGLSLRLFELDANGDTVQVRSGGVSTPQAAFTEYHKYNTDWAHIAVQEPITLNPDTTEVEIRVDARALAGTYYVDNVVFDLDRNQPDGPLG